ncbi:MAG: putative 2-phosphosulfolactate phosphatase [Tepidiforma sp.]|nr:2-phosphosulfolactate phosphatase [Tepidiforma sp.]GIW17194.1 MAG: putative 2-phosphosulfolactate phosphatase [Tepidiforma sp.]
MVREIRLLLLPPAGPWPRTGAAAVVDALRATTTACALLGHGARAVIAADDEQRARRLAAERGALLAGEVRGLPPPGFDLGNSPAAVDRAAVEGREVVLFTTNGTKALCAASAAGAAIAAAAVNAAAAARWLSHADEVLIACAGEAGGAAFALEDFAVAAYLVQLLARDHPGIDLDDAARLALEVPAPLRLVREARHARDLEALGLAADIEFASRADRFDVVPLVTDRGAGWARLEPAPA